MPAPDLQQLASRGMGIWLTHMRAGRIDDAGTAAQSVIDACSSLLDDREYAGEERLRNQALVVGVLFRGLQNLCDFRALVRQERWYEETDLFERAWIHMWDARERLEFASAFVDCGLTNDLLAELRSFEAAVSDALGPGLYMSPEILVDRVECSICGKDYRSCQHLAGALYDGKLCTRRPRGMQIHAVALVTDPVDPRCRAWPWNLEEGEGDDNKLTSCIMRVFSLADFIEGEAGEA